MRKIMRFLAYLISLVFIIFASNSYAMMLCPTNFNPIEIGYTMDQIIRLCGAPDERSEYKDTIRLSNNISNAQSNGNYYQSQNYYSSQSTDGAQELQDTKEKVIIVTKFTYHNPQPAILMFEDGILKERVLPPRS